MSEAKTYSQKQAEDDTALLNEGSTAAWELFTTNKDINSASFAISQVASLANRLQNKSLTHLPPKTVDDLTTAIGVTLDVERQINAAKGLANTNLAASGPTATTATTAPVNALQDQTTFKCEPAVNAAKVAGTQISFNTLTGAEREKQLLTATFLLPIKYPNMFPPGRGVLFYGPPGTGKTLLAQAISTEMRRILEQDLDALEQKKRPQLVYLFAVTGGQLKAGFVGQTEKNIQAAFDCAEDTAQKDGGQTLSVLFLDEVEVIAGKRGGTDSSLNSSVPALLTAIDGVKGQATGPPRTKIIAATNLPWLLDDAFLSRLPLKLFVDLPGDAARRDLIYIELRTQFTRGPPKTHKQLLAILAELNQARPTDNIHTLYRQLLDTAESFMAEMGAPNLDSKDDNALFDLIVIEKGKLADQPVPASQKKPLITRLGTYLQKEQALYRQSLELLDAPLGSAAFNFVVDGNVDTINQVGQLTGMNQQGLGLLRANLGDTLFARYMVESGRRQELNQVGKSLFGYSNRDLVNLVQQAVRNANLRQLSKFDPQLGCIRECPTDPAEGKCECIDGKCRVCKDGKCSTICVSNRLQRYRQRPAQVQLQDFTKAMERVPASASPADYIKVVRYSYELPIDAPSEPSSSAETKQPIIIAEEEKKERPPRRGTRRSGGTNRLYKSPPTRTIRIQKTRSHHRRHR